MEFGVDQIISVVVGIITSFVVTHFKKSTWAGWKIQLTVFGIAIVVATGANLLAGQWNAIDIVANVGIIFGLSEGIYRQFIKKIEDKKE